jgi:hypothetical protein
MVIYTGIFGIIPLIILKKDQYLSYFYYLFWIIEQDFILSRFMIVYKKEYYN